MSGSARRLTSRDYKNTRRQRLDLARARDFSAGLGIGLALAVIAFLYGRSAVLTPAVHAEPQKPVPQKVTPADADADEPASRQYDFYKMLPNFEVVVPEKDREVKRDLPTAKIERPGVYVLQAGSYRNRDDAERIRAQLARQGVDAKVERVAVDTDVWHRVRIGPINDLGVLNRLRIQLRAADLDALVIRVGD